MQYSDADGTLIKRFRKDGSGVWVACVRYKDDSGKWRTKYKNSGVACDKTTAKGRPAAKRFLKSWRSELEEEQRERNALPNGDMLVTEYIDQYLKLREADKTIERSTLSGYRSGAKYLRKFLEGVRLSDLDTDRVDRMKTDMLDAGHSEYTTKKAIGLLSRICNHAIERKAIASNPCRGVKKPKTRRRKPNALDAENVARLNGALEALGFGVKPDMVRMALLTGMRRGELCGLRWMDIDEGAQTIRVRNAIGMDNGSPYEKTPKNDDSERRIDYGSTVAAILKRRKAEQAEACAHLGVSKEARREMFVFGTVSGKPMSPDIASKWFTKKIVLPYRLVGTQNIKPVFHDLRHTFATHALARGMDIESVSKILGHKNASMTLDIYADALPDNKRAVMHQMDEILSQTTGAPAVLAMPATGTDGRD
ncbi:MAG: site-specific integrase [Eggerthellaceae bacterium]|nr:site-specific integrase [Eggerthellaceae bacterium]